MRFVDPDGMWPWPQEIIDFANWATNGVQNALNSAGDFAVKVAGYSDMNDLVVLGSALLSPITGNGPVNIDGTPATSEDVEASTRGLLMPMVSGTGVNKALNAVEETGKKYFRYVGEGEAKIINKTGEIPNVDRYGNPKDIHFTDREYKTGSTAKTYNQLPAKPTHKVEIDPKNVKNPTPFTKINKANNPQWGVGGGRQATTNEPIKVDPSKIEPLKDYNQ